MNVPFKDVSYFNLKVNSSDQTVGSSNVRFFRDGVKEHPLKNTSVEIYMANYIWIKINDVSCYWTDAIICHEMSALPKVK